LKLQLAAGPISEKSLILFVILFFGLHQGLGLIMKVSVTRDWILRLWLEAAACNWLYMWGKFDFVCHFFFGLHQGLGLIMKLSVTRAWILRLRLESTACSWAGLVSVKSFIFFSFFFGLHQGLGLIMKLSVTRAWILRLRLEAVACNWPYM
jgi:hypothetical protein